MYSMNYSIVLALFLGLMACTASYSVAASPVNGKTSEIPVDRQEMEDYETGKSLTVLNLPMSEDEPSLASSKSANGCKVMCNAGRGMCRSRCGVNKRYCCCLQCEW